jgi:hypothetical protein
MCRHVHVTHLFVQGDIAKSAQLLAACANKAQNGQGKTGFLYSMLLLVELLGHTFCDSVDVALKGSMHDRWSTDFMLLLPEAASALKLLLSDSTVTSLLSVDSPSIRHLLAGAGVSSTALPLQACLLQSYICAESFHFEFIRQQRRMPDTLFSTISSVNVMSWAIKLLLLVAIQQWHSHLLMAPVGRSFRWILFPDQAALRCSTHAR